MTAPAGVLHRFVPGTEIQRQRATVNGRDWWLVRTTAGLYRQAVDDNLVQRLHPEPLWPVERVRTGTGEWLRIELAPGGAQHRLRLPMTARQRPEWSDAQGWPALRPTLMALAETLETSPEQG